MHIFCNEIRKGETYVEHPIRDLTPAGFPFFKLYFNRIKWLFSLSGLEKSAAYPEYVQ